MRFIRVEDWSEAAAALHKRLQSELQQGKQVLWLLSGGSNIALSVAVMKNIPAELTSKLVVSLADERYGEVNHIDSNAKQLLDAGFETKEAVFIPVLQPGFSAEETTRRFAEACQRAFEHADTMIVQLGMGSDGHIAGILPGSPAVNASDWVTTYQTPTYTRITLTYEALKKVTVAYAFVWGPDKAETLRQLKQQNLSLSEQPAQFLKALHEAYVYNDQIS